MAWKTLDPLPAARYRHSATSFGGKYVYVAGGSTDFALTTLPLSILKSRIDAGGEGANSPWLSCASDFTVGKIGCQLVTFGNGYLAVVGGRGSTAISAQILPAQDLYIGKIDADGNVPKWSINVGALPAPMIDMGVVVIGGYMYLVGGSTLTITLPYDTQTVNFTVGQVLTGGTSGATALVVSDADAGATGVLTLANVVGTFQAAETITTAVAGSAKATTAQVITATASASIYRAKIDGSGGSVGPFQLLSSVLPAALADPAAMTTGGRLVILDTTNIYSARIQSQGLVEGFTTQVAPFSKISHGFADIQNDDLMAVGGYTGSVVTADVWTATVERDGTLKKWAVTTPMLTAKRDFGMCRIADRLICTGGLDTGNAVLTEVSTARVEPSGAIAGQRF